MNTPKSISKKGQIRILADLQSHDKTHQHNLQVLYEAVNKLNLQVMHQGTVMMEMGCIIQLLLKKGTVTREELKAAKDEVAAAFAAERAKASQGSDIQPEGTGAASGDTGHGPTVSSDTSDRGDSLLVNAGPVKDAATSEPEPSDSITTPS